MNKLGHLIKGVRLSKPLTQKELGDLIGEKQQTIGKWETGVLQPSLKTLIHLSSVLDIERSKLINAAVGEDVILKEKQEESELFEQVEIPVKLTNYRPSSDQLIPAFNVDFIAGNAFESVDNQTIEPDYYMDIPDFRGCTAFRAYSDSMEGLIKSGSLLFGTKVERWAEHLEYGQIYGIVCDDGRKYLKYIKRFSDSPKDHFWLVSENDFYDSFEMPKEFIRSVWLIHGHLTKRI